jgi:putative endonuclease
MDYFVYILHSQSVDKFYVGHSPDPSKRLSEHNSYTNQSKFTAKYQPWTLVAQILVSQIRGEAMKVERYIKKQKSKAFIKEIIFYL